MTPTAVGRRDFIKTGAIAGAGLLIGFRLADARESAAIIESSAGEFAPNAYLRIGTDGAVTLFADHVELGQGVMTSLPMIVAEELDADWSTVKIERMPDDPSAWPRTIMTVGSQSVRGSWQPLRRAGAAAREMLVSAAADSWKVDHASLRTEKGFVIHAASGRRASYGELAAAAAALTPPANPTLKDPKDFRIIGKPQPRVDIPSKVNGSATYGIDVRIPGMLIAAVVRPPVFGSEVKSFNPAAARAVDGVKDVVKFESGVAVLATDTWSALKGRRALEVEWTEIENGKISLADIRRSFTQLAATPGAVARNDGDVDAALRTATNPITVDYELPFAAHATMEPMNCTAHVRADGADVWAPTQAPTSFQRLAAQIAGLQPKDVRLHVTMVGGGFGRRARTDVLEDAVRLSKLAGAPVKVMWTREDDMQHDFYRPFGIHRMQGAIGTDGWPVAWMHRVVTQAALGGGRGAGGAPAVNGDAVGGAADLPYAIPNLRVENIITNSPVPVAPWRSVGHSQNGFVTEAFIDELAAAGKKDPVELRRRLLQKAPRHLGVLELAAEKAGWGKPLPARVARGVAVHSMNGTYVAQIAEVAIDNGDIRVKRVVCAVDCGIVINPDTVAAQMEGAIVYGLTCALKNEITIAGGRVEQANFNTYPMLRMSETPRVEVYIVPSTEAPGGIGEPGVPPIAAAVANAVFAATGKRLRKLPLRLG
jgi:isoquinoline 1-oxidoreductase beta subunit